MAGHDSAPAVLEMQASISRVTGMHSEGVTDVLLAKDTTTPAIEQEKPQETVTAQAPEMEAPTSLPTPVLGANVVQGSLSPMSLLPQSQIQITLPGLTDQAPQSVCTDIFNNCAVGAPMSTPQIDLGIPSLGSNLDSIKDPGISVWKPF